MTELASHQFELFVSYAEADRGWVEGYLLDALDAVGVHSQHEQSFGPGAPRVAEFERAVRSSERTLLVLSRAYSVDKLGQAADLLAQIYGLESGTWPVIPLLFGPVRLPPRLSILTSLDATDPAEWPHVLGRLCDKIGYPPPPPSPRPPCPYVGMAPLSEAEHDRLQAAPIGHGRRRGRPSQR